MKIKANYEEKFKKIISETNFLSLSKDLQNFIRKKSFLHHFSFQEAKKIVDISTDFNMWQENDLTIIWPEHLETSDNNADQKNNTKIYKTKVFNYILEKYKNVQNSKKNYSDFNPDVPQKHEISFQDSNQDNKILGLCPVASEKTRCCNLQTLDAVRNCGFDCSYCSIQSFYYDNKVYLDNNIDEKLNALELEKDKIYHIGTGQSSDSLMWGNKNGLLDSLTNFAKSNSNVILEMKTKSKKIDYFIENDIPKNIICTWSLNPETIIQNEEHYSASLEERLKAARLVADKGILVGFHFHPMVYYKGWEDDYLYIFNKIQEMFNPSEVSLISFGTLTFIKPVLKKLRKRGLKSKILQMPLVDAEGKFSYPLEIKLEMFKFAYNSFKDWHDKVFFYLCMEDKTLWQPVFGKFYETNEDFESDMKQFYMNKINSIK